MAMTGAAMAQAVIDALVVAGKYPDIPASDPDPNVVTLETIKADMEIVYDAVVQYIQNNAVVKTTLDDSLNSIFTTGVPVPNDGGAALQTAWSSGTSGGAKDSATGDPNLSTGGIE